MVCDQPVVTADDTLSCSQWQLVDLESLVTQEQFYSLTELLEFDPVLFGTIATGLILTFISGHIAGITIRGINRS